MFLENEIDLARTSVPVISSHKESRDLNPTEYDIVLKVIQKTSDAKRKFSILNRNSLIPGNNEGKNSKWSTKYHFTKLLESQVGKFILPYFKKKFRKIFDVYGYIFCQFSNETLDSSK